MVNEAELQYYYHGFYRTLKRYRSTSLLGWMIVLLGCLSVPFGWNLGRRAAFLDVALTTLTVFSGLAVVWQNISALDAYLHIPFPAPADGESVVHSEIISEIRSLMKDVENGGWREAYETIGKLKEIQTKYELPELGSGVTSS